MLREPGPLSSSLTAPLNPHSARRGKTCMLWRWVLFFIWKKESHISLVVQLLLYGWWLNKETQINLLEGCCSASGNSTFLWDGVDSVGALVREEDCRGGAADGAQEPAGQEGAAAANQRTWGGTSEAEDQWECRNLTCPDSDLCSGDTDRGWTVFSTSKHLDELWLLKTTDKKSEGLYIQ